MRISSKLAVLGVLAVALPACVVAVRPHDPCGVSQVVAGPTYHWVDAGWSNRDYPGHDGRWRSSSRSWQQENINRRAAHYREVARQPAGPSPLYPAASRGPTPQEVELEARRRYYYGR